MTKLEELVKNVKLQTDSETAEDFERMMKSLEGESFEESLRFGLGMIISSAKEYSWIKKMIKCFDMYPGKAKDIEDGLRSIPIRDGYKLRFDELLSQEAYHAVINDEAYIPHVLDGSYEKLRERFDMPYKDLKLIIQTKNFLHDQYLAIVEFSTSHMFELLCNQIEKKGIEYCNIVLDDPEVFDIAFKNEKFKVLIDKEIRNSLTDSHLSTIFKTHDYVLSHHEKKSQLLQDKVTYGFFKQLNRAIFQKESMNERLEMVNIYCSEVRNKIQKSAEEILLLS